MPKSVVVGEVVAVALGARPASDVIYEMHVRGMTMRDPGVPEAVRGTLAGLAQPKVVGYLRSMGIGAVELMPVTPVATSRRLASAGLRNYWGYNPINFFAVEPYYLAGGGLPEFRGAVEAFHEAGIAVILDMVFNHSGEEDEFGPTVSLRGIDNASYYRLADGGRHYIDWTGCRNTLNTAHPEVRRMVIQALRHWAETGVDGFRLDLAVTLGRDGGQFSPHEILLTEIVRDPVLGKLKLIAEPWDLGPEGYRLGGFLAPWREWNDRFRDGVRRFWRGDNWTVGEFATRISGSHDIFGGRSSASVNFMAAHDGFTLADLVAYNHKRNDANLENGADGSDNNFSWNCGAEGPTEQASVIDLRKRQMRNLLATLFFSAGTPMLRSGDELGQSQGGNNNAYCQDNETTWIDWTRADARLMEFVGNLLRLRQHHPALRGEATELKWFSPRGLAMQLGDWTSGTGHALGMMRADGKSVFLILFNGGDTEVPFVLPGAKHGEWNLWLSTMEPVARSLHPARQTFALPAHSLVLFGDHEADGPSA